MNYQSDEPCVACGEAGESRVCYHHLFTRKVYPEFAGNDWNKIPVCQGHHNEFHSKGIVHMSEKYIEVMRWLYKNDWFFCEVVKKFRREGF